MRWTVSGDAELFRRERAWLEERLADGRSGVERRGGLVVKWSGLVGRARLRHLLRCIAGLPLPRLREHANLAWLREHGFEAPRPILAGAAWSAAGPRFQFLFTEEIKDAETLAEVLLDPARRRRAVLSLAGAVAALHAAGFVHRDLFARNVLMREQRGEPLVVFLDAWRGGPGPSLRGAEYDLGCFIHDAAGLGWESGGGLFLDAYLQERERLGAPLDRPPLERAVRRVRAHRAARDARAARKRARTAT